jgi:hypothetical protein
MAVKDLPPLVWRTCDEEVVTLSEGGAMASINVFKNDHAMVATLVTSGVELTSGKHYWQVEIMSDGLLVGIARPNLDPTGDYTTAGSTDGWFINTYEGGLCGNGKNEADAAGEIDEGDRVGVLLDLDEGSLRFFVNDVQHGPGYPAGSVTGSVVCAVQMYSDDVDDLDGTSVRLLPQDTGHPLLQ